MCGVADYVQEELMRTVLGLPEVKARTGLSRSTIYFRIAQGSFPKPISLGGRAVGWLEAEIQEWLQSSIESSRGVGTGCPNQRR
jgi:prophage regulatory protein